MGLPSEIDQIVGKRECCTNSRGNFGLLAACFNDIDLPASCFMQERTDGDLVL